MGDIKLLLKDNSFFRKTYIANLFLCQISFLQIITYSALPFLFLWGCGLVFYNVKKHKAFLKLRHGLWLIGFLACSLGTSLIYFTSNFLINFFMILQVAICFFLFYGMHALPEEKKAKNNNSGKENYFLCKFVIIATTISGFLGFVFLFFGVSFEFLWVKFAIYENRFTGIYSNPNLLGFSSVVALISCHMLMKKDFIEKSKQKKISRIWLISCVVINTISLFLCDSRAAMLLIVCYASFYLVFVILENKGNEKLNKKMISKLIATALVGCLLITSMFFLSYLCRLGFSAMLKGTTETAQIIVTEEGDVVESVLAKDAPSFHHPPSQTLDNGRIALIKNSAKLFLKYPIIGIGRGNLIEFSQNYLENARLGYNLNYYDLHNGYMTILVSSGILGFAVFSLFGLRFAKDVFTIVFGKFNLIKNTELPCIVSFICAYLIYAMIEKTLLYDISFMVMYFWVLLGFASCFLKKEDTTQYTLLHKRLPKNL